MTIVTGRQTRNVTIGVTGMAIIALAVMTGCGPKLDQQPLVWQTIQEAAQRGDLADVKRHLARGAAVNAEGYGYAGDTPLYVAAESGRTVVCKYLIARGADVNPKRGLNPLYGAAENGHKDVIELLIAKGADVMNNPDYVVLAVRNGHKDVVELLIAKGADVNPKSGLNPLSVAAERGHKDVVELLIAKGADVNPRYGLNPLSAAAREGHKDVVEILRRHGASE